MGLGVQGGSSDSRQLLGTLLVAWSFVTGLAAVFASAVYMQTGDLKVLIAWLGAPFLVGSGLMFAVALTGWATRSKRPKRSAPLSSELRPRNAIHGLQKQR